MIFTIFKSVSKAYVEDMRDVFEDIAWDDFSQILLDRQDIDEKEQGTLYNLARFKNIGDESALLGRKKIYKNGEWTGEYHYFPNTVRRCKDNLISISGILLDFDKDCKIEDEMVKFKNIECVLYTTFNHTIDSHRFRIVFPITRPLLAEDITGKKEHIQEIFQGVDDASFSASQSFYFHAGLNNPVVIHNKGYIIDPYNDFETRDAQPKYVGKEYNINVDFQINEEYRNKVLDSLRSCSGVRYPQALILVACCKSIGLTFNEFNMLCQQISANDSTLIKVPSCRIDLWHSDYERITNEKRDKFIKEHGGRSVPKRVERAIEYQETISDMELLKKILKEKRNARTKHS